MTTPYVDTNFLVRFYVELPEVNAVGSLLSEATRIESEPFPITWLHRAELCNAFQLRVFQARTARAHRITPEFAGAAWAQFQSDLKRQESVRAVGIAPAELERRAEDLSLRHTRRHGFRTYDVLHVASALLLGCDTFWSFDAKAARLAKLEGLRLRGEGR